MPDSTQMKQYAVARTPSTGSVCINQNKSVQTKNPNHVYNDILLTKAVQTIKSSLIQPSNRLIMKNKINIPGPARITPDKLRIPRRSLALTIADQHTQHTQRHALGILHRTPPLTRQQVETYDTVAVDVRVQRDVARRRRAADEDYLGRFDGIRGAEGELQAEGCVGVEGVGGGDGDVDEPGLEVVGADESEALCEGSGL